MSRTTETSHASAPTASSRLTDTAVGQLVAERPGRARIFEQYGIDYCCGGRKPLAEACHERHVDPAAVLRDLSAEAQAPAGDERDWAAAPLAELADHIEATHHAGLRAELPRLGRLTRKVAKAHGERHPELIEVCRLFHRLAEEMESHMADEERVMFPLCRRIEQARTLPEALYGSLSNPIAELTHEHEDAGTVLAELRRLTNDYEPPADACNTYRVMLAGLAALEADMHQHVHKENNILFPKAIALEKTLIS